MSLTRRVAIVGGGISGLATAFYFLREAQTRGIESEVHLFEKSDRLGGVINTEHFDGFLFEWGPENFVPFKPEAVRLVKELGLGHELIGSNDDRRQTFVVNQGRIHPLPDGMAFLAPVRLRSFWATSLLTAPGKLRAILEPLIPRSHGDLTVREFLERRLGRELTGRVAEPLVSAIYGGDIDRLSVVSALPDTYRVEQQHGSLWRGLRQKNRNGAAKLPFFMTLRSGMHTMVQGLTDALKAVSTHTGVGQLRLRPQPGGLYEISSPGFAEAFDSVVLSLPAEAASDLLHETALAASGQLRSIQYTSTSLIYLGYRRSEFSHPLTGFGFVTPENESEVLDACTWVSTKFDGRCPDDSVLLRCAIHDGRRARTFGSAAEVAETAHREVARLLSFSAQPTFFRVSHLGKSMPQMTVGHSQKLAAIDQDVGRFPGVFLTGPFYSGVGVPDCIRSARKTVTRVVDFLESR
jgi:protoporphyrinogen/coproporphyrinogen III oxidase